MSNNCNFCISLCGKPNFVICRTDKPDIITQTNIHRRSHSILISTQQGTLWLWLLKHHGILRTTQYIEICKILLKKKYTNSVSKD